MANTSKFCLIFLILSISSIYCNDLHFSRFDSGAVFEEAIKENIDIVAESLNYFQKFNLKLNAFSHLELLKSRVLGYKIHPDLSSKTSFNPESNSISIKLTNCMNISSEVLWILNIGILPISGSAIIDTVISNFTINLTLTGSRVNAETYSIETQIASSVISNDTQIEDSLFVALLDSDKFSKAFQEALNRKNEKALTKINTDLEKLFITFLSEKSGSQNLYYPELLQYFKFSYTPSSRTVLADSICSNYTVTFEAIPQSNRHLSVGPVPNVIINGSDPDSNPKESDLFSQLYFPYDLMNDMVNKTYPYFSASYYDSDLSSSIGSRLTVSELGRIIPDLPLTYPSSTLVNLEVIGREISQNHYSYLLPIGRQYYSEAFIIRRPVLEFQYVLLTSPNISYPLNVSVALQVYYLPEVTNKTLDCYVVNADIMNIDYSSDFSSVIQVNLRSTILEYLQKLIFETFHSGIFGAGGIPLELWGNLPQNQTIEVTKDVYGFYVKIKNS